MANYSAKERMNKFDLGGLKLPKLKGHVKITLRDLYHTRVIEGENLITDAIADILANNYVGAIDTSKILTLADQWFGGILVYEQAHTLNASNYFIPADDDNHLWAHAGDEAPASAEIAQQDLGRGSPTNTTRTSNSITHTWEWGHSQGNSGDRYIRALALCHKDVGNVGLGNTSDAFKAFSPFLPVQVSELTAQAQNVKGAGNAFVQYDDNHTLFFYIGTDGWYSGSQTGAPKKDVTVYIRRLPYYKAGLFESVEGTTSDTRMFTVTTSVDFWINPSFYFDSTNKYLWLFTNNTNVAVNDRSYSRTKVYYSVIDCVNETEVDHGLIESDDTDLTFLNMVGQSYSGDRAKYAGHVAQSNIIKDGNNVYLPLGNGHADNTSAEIDQNFLGFKKINLSNNDQTTIQFADGVAQSRMYSPIKQGGIISGFGYVVNGDTIYHCSKSPFVSTNDSKRRILLNQTEKPIIYAPTMSPSLDDTGIYPRYLFVNKFLHTTLYNIPQADIFHKTATESMSIQYTIQES